MKAMILAIAVIVVMMESPSVSYANEPEILIMAEAVSSDTAAAVAAQSSGGKVLSVENAGSVYRVKVLLPNGQVKIVPVDVATGAVLN